MRRDIFEVKNISFLSRGPYSLTLRAGDCIGLTGPSGVGKTLLFKAFVDLLPCEGEILLKGTHRYDIPAPLYRSMVSLVLADSVWWYDRVGDHFIVSDQEDSFVHHSLPELGFELDVLEWRVANLSSGERQRLSLLRSLQKKPVVLLLDEPTSSLDGDNTKLVENFVKKYCRKNDIPVIWISHDHNQLLRVSSRQLLLGVNSLTELQGGALR